MGGDFPEPFNYSVAFTTNQHGAPESTCNRPVCQQLLDAINAAQSSIDFAIYGIRAQQHIIDALVAAQARGVVVRGVVDSEDATCTTFGYPDTPVLIAALGAANVHCDIGSGYGYIMHNKFFVFDQRAVWTGSTNISDTELGGEYNSDIAAFISSYKLAAIYRGEMDEMFGSGLFHKRKTDNTQHVVDGSHFTDGTILASYFSPTDHATNNAVIPLINAATQTLDIAMFFFTSQPIADAILAAQARGVAVRMVIDASGAANSYSQHGQPVRAGIPVKTENWGGKSHSKWAVADAALPASAAVVFGFDELDRFGRHGERREFAVRQERGPGGIDVRRIRAPVGRPGRGAGVHRGLGRGRRLVAVHQWRLRARLRQRILLRRHRQRPRRQDRPAGRGVRLPRRRRQRR